MFLMVTKSDLQNCFVTTTKFILQNYFAMEREVVCGIN